MQIWCNNYKSRCIVFPQMSEPFQQPRAKLLYPRVGHLLWKQLDLFKWKQYESEVILLTVRWYLKYSLRYRDLVEMMKDRGLHIAHTTIMRWLGFKSVKTAEKTIARIEVMHMIGKGQVECNHSSALPKQVFTIRLFRFLYSRRTNLKRSVFISKNSGFFAFNY